MTIKLGGAGLLPAILLLSTLGIAGVAGAAPTAIGAVKSVASTPTYIEITCERGVIRVSAAGPGKLRVRAARSLPFSLFGSFAVVPTVKETAPQMREEDSRYLFETGMMRLTIDKRTGRMDVLDGDGKLIVGEPEGGGIFFDGNTVGCVKSSTSDEHFYGFGEKTGPLDKRGTKMVMYNSDNVYTTTQDPLYQSHPFYISIRAGRAHGIFFDNTFRVEYDVAASSSDQVKWSAAGGEVDYWVLAGPAPRDVLTRYQELIGAMNLPPTWGLGYHQCRYSYRTAERVREIRDGFRKTYNIPLDAIYLDIHYMDDYRVFTFDPKAFPDPKGLMDELLADGIKTVVIVDPGVKVDKDYPCFKECSDGGLFCTNEKKSPFIAKVWPGNVYFPDFYRPEVRKWWGDQHKFYTDLGVAGIWNDMNELAGWKNDVRFGSFAVPWGKPDWEQIRHGNGDVPHARIRNVYGLLEAQSTYEGLLRHRSDKRPFVISRAGSPGLQRYSLIWTGDNSSTWGHLACGVPMQLNLGMSGQAFVGADIGGFVGTPSPELYARWIQQGIFSPFCRTHTAIFMPDQEPWSFGDKVTDISRDAINLRYRLLPYTYSVFEEHTRTGWPVMRPLVFEFPDDERVSGIQDQYLWGEWLMVAPVLEKGVTKRRVYLPAGDWFDWQSGARRSGPGEVMVDAPLGRLPLFARAGAIIPMGPEMRFTGEKPTDPLLLVVAPGKTASSFSLYEDAGDGFDYRDGGFARTKIEVTPVSGGAEVRIGAREGKFDPRRSTVELRVFGLSADSKVIMSTLDGRELAAPAATFDRGQNVWLIRFADDATGRTIRISSGN